MKLLRQMNLSFPKTKLIRQMNPSFPKTKLLRQMKLLIRMIQMNPPFHRILIFQLIQFQLIQFHLTIPLHQMRPLSHLLPLQQMELIQRKRKRKPKKRRSKKIRSKKIRSKKRKTVFFFLYYIASEISFC